MQNIHPKKQRGEKAVQMKILTTDKNSYTFEYSFVGDSKTKRNSKKKNGLIFKTFLLFHYKIKTIP